MLDNEHQETQDLLRKSTRPVAPAGLEERILLDIAAIADERAKKRTALANLLRFTAISLVLVAIGQSFLPGGVTKTVVETAKQITENPGGKIAWVWKNTYFIVPLLALGILSKIVRSKAG